MAQQTSALYEPMTGSLNIHPPTHPHLLCVIQQGLTHRQTQPQAHTQTHIHNSSLCDQLLALYSQPIRNRNKKRKKNKRQSNSDTDRQRPKDGEEGHRRDAFCDTRIKFLIFWLVMRNCVILLLKQLHLLSVLTKQIAQLPR